MLQSLEKSKPTRRITIYGDDGTNYSWLVNSEDWESYEQFAERYPYGEFSEDDPPSIGILESIGQSDDCPPFLYRVGVKKITITDPEGYF